MVVVAALLLAGCTASPPADDPACPDGLAEALRQHLESTPLGEREIVEVVVTESPDDWQFASPLVAAMSGCTLVTEIGFDNGDRQIQMAGITEGLDEVAVVERVSEAGWVQYSPETDPGVWGLPDRSESVTIYRPAADPGALGFSGWADYLGVDDVVLVSLVAI